MADMIIDTVNNRIDDYQEKWKRDHKVAEICWKFEHALSGYVELFQVICGLNKSWREGVYGGTMQHTAESECQIKALFDRWISLDPLVQHCLAFFEGQQYKDGVKGADEYRTNLAAAKEALATWTSPKIAVMPDNVKRLIAASSEGRSQSEIDLLKELAAEAIRKNEQRSYESAEKWADQLATDMVSVGD